MRLMEEYAIMFFDPFDVTSINSIEGCAKYSVGVKLKNVLRSKNHVDKYGILLIIIVIEEFIKS